jgi:hypothetical protein
MQGQCLCGTVRFGIDEPVPNLYQCHCKLCRKQGGSASNSATLIPQSQFAWISGEHDIQHWRKDTGFSSDFCRQCGAVVPNQLRELDFIWVPAGALEEDHDLKIVAHIYTGSKANWDVIYGGLANYDEMPAIEDLFSLLTSNRL